MQNLTHEDERRKLFSFPEAKLILANKNCVLGEHYHKLKTEYFILSQGSCKLTVNEKSEWMQIGIIYRILPGEKHSFRIKKDSILVGLNSLPYDPEDDYKE